MININLITLFCGLLRNKTILCNSLPTMLTYYWNFDRSWISKNHRTICGTTYYQQFILGKYDKQHLCNQVHDHTHLLQNDELELSNGNRDMK